MDLRDPMNFFAIAHGCKSTVAPRCIVASGQEHPCDQVVALQRPLECIIVAALRCSLFIIAARCTVAHSPKSLFQKASSCNSDHCRSSLIATPPFIKGGVAMMGVIVWTYRVCLHEQTVIPAPCGRCRKKRSRSVGRSANRWRSEGVRSVDATTKTMLGSRVCDLGYGGRAGQISTAFRPRPIVFPHDMATRNWNYFSPLRGER